MCEGLVMKDSGLEEFDTVWTECECEGGNRTSEVGPVFTELHALTTTPRRPDLFTFLMKYKGI